MKKSTIILVFIAFFAPVLLAVLLHSRWVDWEPGATRNHGELLEPVIALDEFSTVDARNRPVTRDDLFGRWQLVLVQPGVCGEACLERLYWMRQIRAAQDRHQPDVGLVLLSAAPLSADTVAAILDLAPDFLILEGGGARPLMDGFPTSGTAESTYIVDPQANIMMRYPSDADPTGIRKDLRRLLTWTKN